jgi:hypothetical protein
MVRPVVSCGIYTLGRIIDDLVDDFLRPSVENLEQLIEINSSEGPSPKVPEQGQLVWSVALV